MDIPHDMYIDGQWTGSSDGKRIDVRCAIYALLDDSLVEAFGFPRPSRTMCWLVPTALRLRARLLRLLPSRRRPRLRTEMNRPTYPEGYIIERLGPLEKRDAGGGTGGYVLYIKDKKFTYYPTFPIWVSPRTDPGSECFLF